MSKQLLAIIDYGMGNLHSVAKAVESVTDAFHVEIVQEPERIDQASHIILPGVGGIRDSMMAIKQKGIDTVIQKALEAKKPTLGICVGMQALVRFSEENGGVECLNVFPLTSQKFAVDPNRILKVPHMGWNNVHKGLEHPLWQGIESGSRFYFVHSYYTAISAEYTAGVCEYGLPFSAILAKESLFATQFHPEKSHRSGLQLLKNFTLWDGRIG